MAVTESFGGSGLAIIGSVKSFIECVCRTIIAEFGRPDPRSDSNTTYLLREALKTLGLENSRGASKLDEILTAHNKMADALTDMRNNYDPVAHGKDGFLDTLTTNECRAYIVTADSILALLLAACEGKEPDLLSTREPYERFERFHRRIDESVVMEAAIDEETGLLTVTLLTESDPEGVELILEPSKLLYALDRTAYVELLRAAAVAAPIPIEEEPKGLPIVTGAFAEPAPLSSEVVASYDGRLLPLRSSLQGLLESMGGLEAVVGSTSLIDSLLATAEKNMGLDWAAREPLQAALKLGLRRTLTKFGIDAERAEQTAERLVLWLKKSASTTELETVPAA
ncbi:MAG: abortive infection family protein [Deltaproteobacteria bacterium]|nr:abortive infection family protein [Deltaproteobacteria bacterium]